MKEIRRIPVCAPFTFASPNLSVKRGDRIELQRDGPDKPLAAAVLRNDGDRVPIAMESVETLLRAGALGKVPRDFSSALYGLVYALLVAVVIVIGSYVASLTSLTQTEFTWRSIAPYAAASAVIGFFVGMFMRWLEKRDQTSS